MISFRASQGCQSLNSYLVVGRGVSVKNYHKNLAKHETDERLVYEYLRDYSKGLTVCEFLNKLYGGVGAQDKLRFRPRFSDLNSKGLVTKQGVVCSVCGQNETKYKLVEEE